MSHFRPAKVLEAIELCIESPRWCATELVAGAFRSLRSCCFESCSRWWSHARDLRRVPCVTSCNRKLKIEAVTMPPALMGEIAVSRNLV